MHFATFPVTMQKSYKESEMFRLQESWTTADTEVSSLRSASTLFCMDSADTSTACYTATSHWVSTCAFAGAFQVLYPWNESIPVIKALKCITIRRKSMENHPKLPKTRYCFCRTLWVSHTALVRSCNLEPNHMPDFSCALVVPIESQRNHTLTALHRISNVAHC